MVDTSSFDSPTQVYPILHRVIVVLYHIVVKWQLLVENMKIVFNPCYAMLNDRWVYIGLSKIKAPLNPLIRRCPYWNSQRCGYTPFPDTKFSWKIL